MAAAGGERMVTETGGKNSPLPQIPVNIQRVLPRTVPGPVSPQNKGALDWGWQGFLAYGAQTTVVVVDPVTLQCAQTLTRHRNHVVKVRWRKTRHYHQLSAPYSLILASADNSGTIIVWEVTRGEVTATLQDGNRPIQELEWLGGVDGSEHLLAALHPPYSLIIWDTRHNNKLWKKSYTENLTAFHFDPFHFNKMAFLCGGCVLFVEDFSLNKCPSSNGRKFYVSTPRTSPGKVVNSIPTSTSSTSITDERTSTRIRRKMRELVVGEGKPKSEDVSQLAECLQLMYHRTVRDQLLLLYTREILVLDLTINQTVGIVVIDRAMSPFSQVLSCWQRDVLFCLHESGSVSAHFRRRLLPVPTSPENDKENTWHGEHLRLNKQSRPIGLTLDPVSEKQMAMVLGDGRVVFKQVTAYPTPGRQAISTPLFTPGAPSAPSQGPHSGLNIADNHFSLASAPAGVHINMPKTSLADMVKPAWALADNVKEIGHRVNLRILMTGLMPAMSPPPLVIRMCPPLTTRNIQQYVPRLAAGTQSGVVQVFNVATGVLEREFALHTYPVRGVEWTSLTSILSFGHQPLTNSQGLVRNELMYTDILTGRTITLRPNKSDETSIDMVRVSYLKQYFIVVFREDPFELWDARKLVPLRTMPRRFPRVSALEWSPTSHVKTRRDSESHRASESEPEKNESVVPKEAPQTEVSMTESMLSLADVVISSLFLQSQMSVITSIAWKSHEIVLSDSDGNLIVWDLKTRISRHIATHRGWIRKIRFAPGRDNMKLVVLFADGIDVWDVRDVVMVSQIKSPRDIVKVVDVDWGASDRPVLATIDGCLRVMDMALKSSSTPIYQYCTKEPIVSPYLLPGEASLNLRTLMTQQPWRSQYSLSFTGEDGFTPEQLQNIEVWLSRVPAELREFLETCGSTAHRALVTAQLFGDQGEIDFWTVACHYLTQPALTHPKDESSSSNSSVGSAELITLGDSASEKSGGSEDLCPPTAVPPSHPLETTYHHLCDAATYKHHELERLAIHESKNLEGAQRATLGRCLAVIGERDRAVRLLLDADASNQHFYTDCLRACLLAATHHSTQAQSTIKLVATNLIAAGNIWEGVELLCLIGKAGDACRYLQSYGHWENSVWLAKCALPLQESVDILKRWAHHLITSANKDQGVCALLSVGSITAALEQLVQQHYHQRAALLLAAAQQLQVVPNTQQQQQHPLATPLGTQSGFSPVLSGSTSMASFAENIHKKYVLHLFSLGNRPAVSYFCRLMGEKGQSLLQELDSLQ
ncbi:WD repeat-containing protein 11-like [Homarus americanus]|uniref:WD repeat-containing protein 11-like n=1 Tax=Homarus americanus TaxID=6706 RepID=A0A8J5N9Y1_HOMAM|nr:WD repeat-containing protein 11-like [Homarus americanus]